MDVQYLTVKQVATRLNVSVPLIYRLLISGELEGLRVGSAWRVPLSGLERYLSEHTTCKPSQKAPAEQRAQVMPAPKPAQVQERRRKKLNGFIYFPPPSD